MAVLRQFDKDKPGIGGLVLNLEQKGEFDTSCQVNSCIQLIEITKPSKGRPHIQWYPGWTFS